MSRHPNSEQVGSQMTPSCLSSPYQNAGCLSFLRGRWKCRTRKCGTKCQGWKMQDLNMQKHAPNVVSYIRPAVWQQTQKPTIIVTRLTPPSNPRRSTSMPRSRWFRAFTISSYWQCSALWRRGVSCPVVRTDDADDARVVSSGVWSGARCCLGVCSWARNGRLPEASVAALQEVFASITVTVSSCHMEKSNYSTMPRIWIKKVQFVDLYRRQAPLMRYTSYHIISNL